MTPIEQLFIFKIQIFKKIFLIITAGLATGLIVGQRQFALGFLIGGVLAVSTLSLLYKYILEIRKIDQNVRKSFIIPRALLIYAIFGVTLFIAIKKGIPAFLGTTLGILSLKIAIFIQVFKEKHVSA